MDYFNCKDLPLWAEILLHNEAAPRAPKEQDEPGLPSLHPCADVATAA